MIDLSDLLEPLYRNAPSKDDVKLPQFIHSSNVAVPILEVVVDRSYLTNIFLNAITDFFDWSSYSKVAWVPSELTKSSLSSSTGGFVVYRLIVLHLSVILATCTCVRNAISLICGAVLVILCALSSISSCRLGLLLWRCTRACFTCSAASSSN